MRHQPRDLAMWTSMTLTYDNAPQHAGCCGFSSGRDAPWLNEMDGGQAWTGVKVPCATLERQQRWCRARRPAHTRFLSRISNRSLVSSKRERELGLDRYRVLIDIKRIALSIE